MDFAKVNYGLNQAYFVETGAFEEIVRGSIEKLTDYKIEDVEVIMNREHANVKISLVLLTNKTSVKYSKDIPEIEKNINDHVLNLIDGKPLNIKIKIKRADK